MVSHLSTGLQRVVGHTVLGHLQELQHSLLQVLLGDHGFGQAAVQALHLLVLAVHLGLQCQQLVVQLCPTQTAALSKRLPAAMGMCSSIPLKRVCCITLFRGLEFLPLSVDIMEEVLQLFPAALGVL